MERDIYEKKKEVRSIVKSEEVKSIQELHDNNILMIFIYINLYKYLFGIKLTTRYTNAIAQ